MLTTLITLGRNAILAAAVLTVAAGTLIGWGYGSLRDSAAFGFIAAGVVTPNRLVFAWLGGAVGLLAAGTVFGLAAAVFDMQRSLRILAREREPMPALASRADRVEPRSMATLPRG